MKRFAQLLKELDDTTSTTRKVSSLAAYFEDETEEKNKLWTLALFAGRRPPRPVSTMLLREWCAAMSGIPLWLFEQNYHVVGDLAETISLVLPEPSIQKEKPLYVYLEELILLKNQPEEEKRTYIETSWQTLFGYQRWAFTKCITGGFRIGVSKNLIIQALEIATALPANVVAHRLMGHWDPQSTSWNSLFGQESDGQISKPYPFYLAYPLPKEEQQIFCENEWAAEWKWDGIRGQLIFRNGQYFIWSRGEELVTDQFPELTSFDGWLHDIVVDGEIVAWRGERPMDFQFLQTRIGRKNPGKKLLQDVPVCFIAYDLLEWQGQDIREKPLSERRALLESFHERTISPHFHLSPWLSFDSIGALERLRMACRSQDAEGLMLKKKSGKYLSGRKSGEIWKWKSDPFSIDAVMLYAQRGHGRRANLFSDFTFALWQEGKLVPFAKAYSGLTDKEMQEVTAFVRQNTLEQFGPVHSVNPVLVFEIAFEGIQVSKRHKSGVAVRFPRILRWRKDKLAEEADQLDTLIEMIKSR